MTSCVCFCVCVFKPIEWHSKVNKKNKATINYFRHSDNYSNSGIGFEKGGAGEE